MKTATVVDVMSWGPCKEYTPGRIIKLFAGRESVSALDILDMDIPAKDKLWAVLREDMIDAKALHTFACDVAENALKRSNVTDKRSWNAIAVKRRWINGNATDDELAAALKELGEAAQSI